MGFGCSTAGEAALNSTRFLTWLLLGIGGEFVESWGADSFGGTAGAGEGGLGPEVLVIFASGEAFALASFGLSTVVDPPGPVVVVVVV